jgi:hypothetical protein
MAIEKAKASLSVTNITYQTRHTLISSTRAGTGPQSPSSPAIMIHYDILLTTSDRPYRNVITTMDMNGIQMVSAILQILHHYGIFYYCRSSTPTRGHTNSCFKPLIFMIPYA